MGSGNGGATIIAVLFFVVLLILISLYVTCFVDRKKRRHRRGSGSFGVCDDRGGITAAAGGPRIKVKINNKVGGGHVSQGCERCNYKECRCKMFDTRGKCRKCRDDGTRCSCWGEKRLPFDGQNPCCDPLTGICGEQCARGGGFGQGCLGSTCTVDGDCQKNLFCDTLNGVCAKKGIIGDPCDSDNDCLCNLACRDNVCTSCTGGGPGGVGDACVRSTDCRRGFHCSQTFNVCVLNNGSGQEGTECSTSADCNVGLVCGDYGYCTTQGGHGTSCVGNEDCDPGCVCIAGSCQCFGGGTCTDDSTCGVGGVCKPPAQGGLKECVYTLDEPCERNDDCAAGQDCVNLPANGRCAILCENTTDCVNKGYTGFNCGITGVCGTPCTTQADCGGGQICNGGVCTPVGGTGGVGDDCQGDSDCLYGLECFGAFCQHRASGTGGFGKVGVGLTDSGAPCVDSTNCGGGVCGTTDYRLFSVDAFDTFTPQFGGKTVIHKEDIGSLLDLDIRDNALLFLYANGSAGQFTVTTVTAGTSTDVSITVPQNVNYGGRTYSLMPKLAELAGKYDATTDLIYVLYRNTTSSTTSNRYLVVAFNDGLMPRSVAEVIIASKSVVEYFDLHVGNGSTDMLIGLQGNVLYYVPRLEDPVYSTANSDIIQNATVPRFTQMSSFTYIDIGDNSVVVYDPLDGPTVRAKLPLTRGVLNDYAMDSLAADRALFITKNDDVLLYDNGTTTGLGLKAEGSVDLSLTDARSSSVFIISRFCHTGSS